MKRNALIECVDAEVYIIVFCSELAHLGIQEING